MTRLKIYFSLIVLIISVQTVFSKSVENAYFQQGERVCFVGNSITNNGEFHHNILLYYITRFPEKKVTFFNCGISGDITESILYRMDDDILINNPTSVVLMIGMNDIKRGLYTANITINSDTLLLRQKAIDRYKINLEKILNVFIDSKIKVILQAPSIYDQTATLSSPNNFGSNDALKICADFIHEMGQKYNFPVIDYWNSLSKINTELQRNDPNATIIGNDRVHPGSAGHFIMAYEFLKTQNVPSLVSEVSIAAKEKEIIKTYNCDVKNLNFDNQEINFTIKEGALPFPINTNQNQALKLVPFQNELNNELLQVTGLKSGNYCLYIDKVLIAKFSELQLRDGVNLSFFSTTPQYQQALKVRSVLMELWKIEAQLRSIKFIEYCNDLKECPDKSTFEAIVNYLKPIFDKRNSVFYSMQLNNYVANKKNEAELFLQSNALRKKAYITALPVEHFFTIEYANM